MPAHPAETPRWHAALTVALTGQLVDDLPESGRPENAVLAVELIRRSTGGRAALVQEVRQARAEGRWPHVVSPELMAGIGPAQFTAALDELAEVLSVEPPRTTRRSGIADSERDDQRLLDEVPPHHGT